jgi:hypothetical protein
MAVLASMRQSARLAGVMADDSKAMKGSEITSRVRAGPATSKTTSSELIA